MFYCFIVLLFAGCKQVYDSPVHSPVTGYLVIDGVLNGGKGPATITVTRSTKLDTTAIVYEKGASVQIEGENGSLYFLAEQAPGYYGANDLNLDSAKRYRLRITARTGKIYLSDFAGVNSSPAIDSISWKRDNGDGLQLYINTHDPKNNTHYYQWKYDETWQIRSAYLSYLKYFVDTRTNPNKFSVGYRDSSTFAFDASIFNCWQYNSSSNLLIGSTAQLSADLVNLPLTFIPHEDIRLGVLYSIDVRQYTWTKDGYEFLQRMKKNTESTGSIFDAQPSSLGGNIHCVSDSSETVIGYFNISAAQEKRIFIRNDEVPLWGYSPGCFEIVIANNSDSILKYGVGLYPTTPVMSTPFGISTFGAAPPICVDCTLRGNNNKPSYWP